MTLSYSYVMSYHSIWNSLCHALCPLCCLRSHFLTSRGPGWLRGGWWMPVWDRCCGSSYCCAWCRWGVLGGVLSRGWWRLRLGLGRTGNRRLRSGVWSRVSVWWRGFGCAGLGDFIDDRWGGCGWRAGRAWAASTRLQLKKKKIVVPLSQGQWRWWRSFVTFKLHIITHMNFKISNLVSGQ